MIVFAQHSFLTPHGDLTVTEEDGAIVALDWGRGPPMHQRETPVLLVARTQLDEYLTGRRKSFDLPLNPHGTATQKALWRLLYRIPYGQTRTYGDLAKESGASARSVGTACGANPIPIIIPCHRVLAAGGKIGGYSGDGGVETKVRLLRLEGALL